MPLPAGFKVNGSKVRTENHVTIPPRQQKIIDLLTNLPPNELLTTLEMSTRLRTAVNGNLNHPALSPFRAKVDNKLFWGNRKSIAQLQAQLNHSEENPSEN